MTYSNVTCVWKDMEIAEEIGSNPASKKQLTNGKPETKRMIVHFTVHVQVKLVLNFREFLLFGS